MAETTKEIIKEFEYKGHKCSFRQYPHLGLTYGYVDGELYYIGSECPLVDDIRISGQPSDFDTQDEEIVTNILKVYTDNLEYIKAHNKATGKSERLPVLASW